MPVCHSQSCLLGGFLVHLLLDGCRTSLAGNMSCSQQYFLLLLLPLQALLYMLYGKVIFISTNNLKSHVKYRVCNKEQVVRISFLCPSLICQLNEFSVFEIWSSHTSSLLPDARLCPCSLSLQITLFLRFTRVS